MPVKVLLAACGLLVAARAGALQPLEEFLDGARKSGVDNAEARALRRQAGAEARAELGRALPRLSLRGEYIRNEFETVLQLPGAGGGPAERVTVTPRDQLDGTATLVVPLVDLASFARIGAARSGARAAERQETSTDLASQARVVQDYYQLVANVALVGASSRALEVARAGLRIAEERHDAGSTGLLDVDRARAEVERNVQQLASAELQVSLVARELRSLTGIAPEVGGEAPLADDLHEEPPLERFQPADDQLPAVAAAIESRVAADRQARAQRFVLVPSLDASLTERVSNAEGLAGRDAYWQAVVGLSWSIDLTTLAGIRAQEAAADAARAREERVRLAARDDIHRAWASVRTHIARSRSARTEAQVSGRAAELAMQRYQAGAAAQLDLLQALRDAFNADAARIQADADLVNARAQLRLAAGESLLQRSGRGAP
ncbi:TolC family protein [Anaeromyxobacter sp. Fw109-5]|uniref:TolC family protein n=1 Tax=Anaeromyxobacter sp. (strain Fw109-5) TaxID=404589 RepID=UPI000158A7F1|nr:TolC family protein [Anaeromyxobacter sp. Fw109-5]ABS25231.1 outer membrane efflux protein [Anaeromyxobacter sp. Fw109-5]